jgi:F-type H+-transporting ATPase subunit b
MFRFAFMFASLASLSVALPAQASTVPQLDPVSYPSQLFWLFISFAFMVLMVRKTIAPNIEHVLAHRKTSIEDAIREAEAYRARAAQADQNMNEILMDAKTQVSAMMQQEQTQAALRSSETMHALDLELKTKLTKAEADIANAKSTAMGQVQEHAANLTKTMVEKLLGGNVDVSDALNLTRKVS